MTSDGPVPIGGSRAQFAAHIRTEIDKRAKVISASGDRSQEVSRYRHGPTAEEAGLSSMTQRSDPAAARMALARRTMSCHSLEVSFRNTVSASASTTSQSPRSSSPRSWPGAQPE